MRRFLCAIIAVLMTVCMCTPGYAAQHEPIGLSDEQRAAANLFLSNFTETGMQSYDAYGEEGSLLVDFAIEHMWFNDKDAFESGDYMGDYNYRVADDDIQNIIDKYFYYPREVDITQTRFEYADGYYYLCDTGGWISCGFAYVLDAYPIEDGKYFVSFMVFGGGNAWENDVMGMSLDEIETEFGHPTGYGSAIIYADELADRSTYRLMTFARV